MGVSPTFIQAAFLCLCVALLGRLTSEVFFSTDLLFYIRIGQDFFESGLSPFVDHYSIKFENQAYSSIAWLFSWLTYPFYKLGGLSGVLFLKFVLVATPLILTWRFYFYKKNNLIGAIFCLTLLTCAILTRFYLRPEMLSWTFIVLLGFFLKDYKSLPSTKVLGLISLFLLVWTNYHGVYFGYFILFSSLFYWFVLETTKSDVKFDPRRLGRYLLVAIVFFLIGFINFFGAHPLLQVLEMDPFWQSFIAELKPTDFFASDSLVQAVIVSTPFLVVFCLIKKRWDYALMLSYLLYSSFSTNKLVIYICLIAIPVWVMVFYGLKEFVEKGAHRRWRRYTVLVVCLLFTAAAVQGATFRLGILKSEFHRDSSGRFTNSVQGVDIARKLKENYAGGTIFNDYNLGAGLILFLGSEAKIWLDGRTNILYDKTAVTDWYETHISSDRFQELNKEHNFQWVAMEAKHLPAVHYRSPFKVYFSDSHNYLLGLGKSPFPAIDKVLRNPSCFTEISVTHWENDFKSVDQVAKDSMIAITLAFVLGYHKAENKAQFLLKSIKETEFESYYVRKQHGLIYRIQAEILGQMKKPLSQSIVYQRMADKTFMDHLKIARVLILHKSYEQAAEELKQSAAKNYSQYWQSIIYWELKKLDNLTQQNLINPEVLKRYEPFAHLTQGDSEALKWMGAPCAF